MFGRMLGIDEGVLGKGFLDLFLLELVVDLLRQRASERLWWLWERGRAATSEPPDRASADRSGRRMQGWSGGEFVNVGRIEFGGIRDRGRGQFRGQFVARELVRRRAAGRANLGAQRYAGLAETAMREVHRGGG
jgi:hypothetical protein